MSLRRAFFSNRIRFRLWARTLSTGMFFFRELYLERILWLWTLSRQVHFESLFWVPLERDSKLTWKWIWQGLSFSFFTWKRLDTRFEKGLKMMWKRSWQVHENGLNITYQKGLDGTCKWLENEIWKGTRIWLLKDPDRDLKSLLTWSL